ncbi:MAG TPA: FecR domain-containing protein [Pyrinomonadaceae bacterium]|nr:FecR domain-containing protein [Pyrinomonadaceae bacterium]
MRSNKELDSILDKVTEEIRNEAIDPAVTEQAAGRVWARLAAETPSALPMATPVVHIESCRDFQSLIPAYLNRSLSEARSLLLEDHTHECIPCRRAMKEARNRNQAPARPAVQPRRFNISPVVMRWGIAAVLVIGFTLLAIPLIQRYSPFGGQFEATVQAAEGQVYQINDTKSSPVIAGTRLEKGETIRTAKDAHAFVRLGDGSMIEVKDRTELSLTKNGQGTTIHLKGGNIIVEAAKQRNQHLFVDTGDANIAVTGTIFSVNHGTKGVRVSVIEGDVHVDHAGLERAVRAGEQVVTNASIAPVAIKDEVAWSRNAAKYASTLASLHELKSELAKVPMPGVRNSTRLLDLMPENTVFYAALPNLTSTLAESHRIMQDRINQNPALREWWEKEHSGRGPNMDQVMGTIREFGDYLGEEIAVSVGMDAKGEPVSPLVVAELKNSSGFRQFLEQQMAKYAANAKDKPKVVFVDDPMTATAAPETDSKKIDQLYVWISNDLFVASPKLPELQSVASVIQKGGTSSFTGTPFRARIAQIYQEGAGLVVAANLQRVLEQTSANRAKGPDAAKHEEALKQLGVLNLKYFVLDQNQSDGKTHTRASLSFNEAQRGIPSWLAAPAPMRSLEYITPDANVVAGFAVKDPVALVDDLLGAIETVSPGLRDNLNKLQADHGIDIRKDFAAPMGGEFAFAVDGPILPTPSWKMVFQVNDSEHLQQTFERVVTEINNEAAKHGKAGLTWDRGEIGGRTYYTLKSTDFAVEVNYTYANGYMIVGPSRGLVERAVSTQAGGYTLLRSPKFTAGLPADGNANFSAVFYHNLGSLVAPFSDKLANSAGNLPKEQQEAIRRMASNMQPTLAYAYANGDSITFAANTEGGPFGLGPGTLLGMPNALEMQHVLSNGMKGK